MQCQTVAAGRLTCELRPSRHSAAPFTSSTLLLALLGAVRRVWTPELAAGAAAGAEQITLIDFLSLSNSRVASFLHLQRVQRADLSMGGGACIVHVLKCWKVHHSNRQQKRILH